MPGIDYPELAPDQAYRGDISSRIVVQAENRLFHPAESPRNEKGDQQAGAWLVASPKWEDCYRRVGDQNEIVKEMCIPARIEQLWSEGAIWFCAADGVGAELTSAEER